MVLAANYNIMTQCPQIYIYIISVITSALVSLKLCNKVQFLWTLISGVISTIILMGINYCDWSIQLITWIFSALFILITISNLIIFFFATPEQLEKIKETEN